MNLKHLETLVGVNEGNNGIGVTVIEDYPIFPGSGRRVEKVLVGLDGSFRVNVVGDVFCAWSVPSLAIEFSMVFLGVEVEVVRNTLEISARWTLQSFGLKH